MGINHKVSRKTGANWQNKQRIFARKSKKIIPSQPEKAAEPDENIEPTQVGVLDNADQKKDEENKV